MKLKDVVMSCIIVAVLFGVCGYLEKDDAKRTAEVKAETIKQAPARAKRDALELKAEHMLGLDKLK